MGPDPASSDRVRFQTAAVSSWGAGFGEGRFAVSARHADTGFDTHRFAASPVGPTWRLGRSSRTTFTSGKTTLLHGRGSVLLGGLNLIRKKLAPITANRYDWDCRHTLYEAVGSINVDDLFRHGVVANARGVCTRLPAIETRKLGVNLRLIRSGIRPGIAAAHSGASGLPADGRRGHASRNESQDGDVALRVVRAHDAINSLGVGHN